MWVLTEKECCKIGLKFMRKSFLDERRYGKERNINAFKKHYGSSPYKIAEMWCDMHFTRIENVRLTDKEGSEKGFKMHMMAHHFLWAYPKNAALLASRFDVCEKYASGKHLWHWIRKVAGLSEMKIVWDEDLLDDPDLEVHRISVDGVDFKTWEIKHELYNKDNTNCSQKFNGCGLKYEVALACHASKVVWISGPDKPSTHDLTMMRKNGLFERIRQSRKKAEEAGKLSHQLMKCNGDKAYRTSAPDEIGFMSTPNQADKPEVKELKVRIRMRQESFFGRLKKFRIMSDMYTHDTNKHKFVFYACCVIVQYQMDNGSPLFSVR